MTAYLYIMDRGDARKIGYSKDPKTRRLGVAADWECDPIIAATFTFDGDIQVAEKAAHDVLSEFRDRGEWFRVSVEVAKEAILSIGAVECEIPPRKNRSDLAKTFRFDDEELELLEAAKRKHGTYKAAVMAGLYALSGTQQGTNRIVASMLRKLADDLENKRFN